MLRRRRLRSPDTTLGDLARLDARLDANLDGLRHAGPAGWELCLDVFREPSDAEVFALSVLAFESGERARLDRLIAGVAADPGREGGMVSALGWVGPAVARPWV